MSCNVKLSGVSVLVLLLCLCSALYGLDTMTWKWTQGEVQWNYSTCCAGSVTNSSFCLELFPSHYWRSLASEYISHSFSLRFLHSLILFYLILQMFHCRCCIRKWHTESSQRSLQLFRVLRGFLANFQCHFVWITDTQTHKILTDLEVKWHSLSLLSWCGVSAVLISNAHGRSCGNNNESYWFVFSS